ncbi:MAG TPA: efflux RND transporter periplasmic adaptor subunit [Candidatus Angelobacter sp.]|nr:efflux RND transporter periplasmic adaptor subunit [Candidatus Angelobacter sp.]
MKSAKLLLIAIVAVPLGIAGCSSDRMVVAKTPEIARGISLTQVQERPTEDLFEVVGTVRALLTAPISAEIMGRITSVKVQEGDSVKQGETLLTIEDVQPKAGLEQAQAGLTAADHEVAAAESELTLAQSTFARLKKLHEEKSISPQEFDEIKTRVQSATARRDSAVAARAQAAAGLQQATILLDRARVRAPFGGVVTERHIDPGVLASPGLPLLTIESAGRYRLEVNVNENDLKYLRLGVPVPVLLDAYQGTQMTGKVVQIVPAADPASRSFVAKLELPANASLRSGQFGHAEFTRGLRKAIFIPHTAVLEHGQLQSVYAIDDNNVAALRYVTLGKARAADIEILSGLNAGEKVVSDPSGRDLAGKRIEAR